MALVVCGGRAQPDSAPASLFKDSILYPGGSAIQTRIRRAACSLGNLGVMSALLPEYEGRVNLIYAEPAILYQS